MAFVLDSSVGLAWCFEDEVTSYPDRVLELLDQEVALVPSVWPLELANAIGVAERRQRLSRADSSHFLALIKALPIEIEPLSLDRAVSAVLDLARAQQLSYYDAAYLELAMREGCPLATQDRQLGEAAALLLRLCWQAGVAIGYLHGTAMAWARDCSAGEGKTDPKDAFVLADVARAHPRRVVWLEPTDEARARLEPLGGYDADLRADANRLTNRLRALLGTHWPALERALGERLDTRPVLAVLQKYPSGPALARAGAQRIASRLKIEHAFFALPEAAILTSLPGIGPRLVARTAIESRHGHHRLKNAFCLARRRVDVLHARLAHRTPYRLSPSDTHAALAEST